MYLISTHILLYTQYAQIPACFLPKISTTLPKFEQHHEQVCIVHDAVVVQILRQALAGHTERVNPVPFFNRFILKSPRTTRIIRLDIIFVSSLLVHGETSKTA